MVILGPLVAYHTQFRQSFQNLLVADVIDKYTHRIVTRGQGKCGMVKWDFEEEQI